MLLYSILFRFDLKGSGMVCEREKEEEKVRKSQIWPAARKKEAEKLVAT